MDVHPIKNGIFIGIDPYPHGKLLNDQRLHTKTPSSQAPWSLNHPIFGSWICSLQASASYECNSFNRDTTMLPNEFKVTEL